jgi:hypothetical protein
VPTTKAKPQALTAAAQILHSKRIQRQGGSAQRKASGMPWQQAAWDFYDEIGEYALGVDMLAWGVSRVRLVAAEDSPNEDEPRILTSDMPEEGTGEDPPTQAEMIAADLAAGFAGGQSGQQQLFRRIATQLIVTAESFVVGRTDPDTGDDTWEAYSRDEVRWKSGQWSVDDGVDKFTISDDDVLIRIWLPSPRRRQEPRSSTKTLLPILSEIRGLTASIAAQIDSRLAGAGLLILPKSVELVGGATAADDDEDGIDPFVADFIDAMVTPIKDRDSASAVVPIIIKVDDDAVDKVKYIRFESTANMQEAEKREQAVTRLARSMDLPPEQLLGMGSATHWNSWQISEDTVNGPIFSYFSIISNALTMAWYRPALEVAWDEAGIAAESRPDLNAQMLWGDTGPLTERPDLSEKAQQVFDRGGLTVLALARANGFSDEDVPNPEELLRIALFQLLKTKPELVIPLLADAGALENILRSATGEITPPEQNQIEQDTSGTPDGQPPEGDTPPDPTTAEENAA